MNKTNILIAIVVVLIYGSLTYFYMHKDDKNHNNKRVILKTVETKNEHYIKFADKNTIYIEDVKKGSIKPLARVNGKLRPSMSLSNETPLDSYRTILDSSLVDPLSLGLEIYQSIPHTYESNLESSSKYIATLSKENWKQIAKYSNTNYVDIYFKKDKLIVRVLVLKDSLKIFQGIKGKLPNCMTYITEERSEK